MGPRHALELAQQKVVQPLAGIAIGGDHVAHLRGLIRASLTLPAICRKPLIFRNSLVTVPTSTSISGPRAAGSVPSLRRDSPHEALGARILVGSETSDHRTAVNTRRCRRPGRAAGPRDLRPERCPFALQDSVRRRAYETSAHAIDSRMTHAAAKRPLPKATARPVRAFTVHIANSARTDEANAGQRNPGRGVARRAGRWPESMTSISKSRPGNRRKPTSTKVASPASSPASKPCFVDYGAERHGFLPFKEISRDYFKLRTAAAAAAPASATLLAGRPGAHRPGREGRARQQGRGAHDVHLPGRPLPGADAEQPARRRRLAPHRGRGPRRSCARRWTSWRSPTAWA